MASIDGLRGIAALSVFTFHGWLYTMPKPDASQRSTVGDYAAHELRLGLVLFFVLSGFLLSRPWFAAALDERRPPDLRRYLRSRVARIAPAYYVALVGSIGLLWGLSGTPGLRLPPAERAAAVLRLRTEHLAGERHDAQPADVVARRRGRLLRAAAGDRPARARACRRGGARRRSSRSRCSPSG